MAKQGLIYISPMTSHPPPATKKQFSIGVHSPDDLDLTLYFEHPYTFTRWDVIDFVKKMPKQNTTYLGVLRAIQKQFNGGEIGW